MRPIRAMAVALALLVTVSGVAQESIVDRWYAALLKADGAALSELLAENATIRLDDIGVTQSKQEFLASMDEWQSAVKGATIRHKVEAEMGDTVAVRTCYDFPNNDMTTRETFTTKDGLIVANTQMTIGENCDGF
ncbi:SnoaL-like domain protein [Aminobacter sp. MSH1]|uniref:Ketosteroid isomerase-like protein n=1 Tax=Aminobacter niigataensis TaxID=83265 RepID=A0ABR6L273_9HYPH|nr:MULTISPECIES: nuclear transport factor 2 family protein [Aminobacter]AWC21726.1 SnoaL-like domain protein [Aminobacter sp. MSH1]MBB4650862.1 ketosteroid isomerase-like protein [Aminobacter niigataensis]